MERVMSGMSLKKFGRIVALVMETLPKEFEPYLDNVVVDVEDEPSVEMLQDLGYTEEEIAQGETLLGLFSPMPLPSAWGGDVIDMRDLPPRLFIFKRPHEDSYAGKRLLIEIRKTVIHELAHHFGLTDRDLERFDDKPDPFGDDWEKLLEV